VAPDQYALVPAQKKVSIPDTGHIPMIERPEVFNQTLNEFLTGTSTHG
jgi:pimeloyl-ACP methyl ester carboxylesterase